MELISTKIEYISNTDIDSVKKNDIVCGTLELRLPPSHIAHCTGYPGLCMANILLHLSVFLCGVLRDMRVGRRFISPDTHQDDRKDHETYKRQNNQSGNICRDQSHQFDKTSHDFLLRVYRHQLFCGCFSCATR